MSEMHEPVEHVTLWEDGGVIMIKTWEPHGDPVEMNEDEARALAQALSSLIQEISLDLP
ncbi:MAG TPA: hypothetical protein VE053_05305 [Allosphingosinicella sp.]|nr:hypothetical protein [Allosphingosinicella sp.]